MKKEHNCTFIIKIYICFKGHNNKMGVSEMDDFQALLKKVVHHMRANRLSASEMIFLLDQHEKEVDRDNLLNAALSSDPQPLDPASVQWSKPTTDLIPHGKIVICIDGDEHVVPANIFGMRTPSEMNLLYTFMRNNPGVTRIYLPKECKTSFMKVVDVLEKRQTIRSLIESKKLEIREDIRKTLIYLGFQSLDVGIPVKTTEVISNCGEVTWCTNNVFKNIIFSTTEKPVEGFAADVPVQNDWGKHRVEAFLLEFGRTRIMPELIRLDVPKTSRVANSTPNRFRMWVFSPEGNDVAAKLDSLRKQKEADSDYVGITAPDGWKVLGVTDSDGCSKEQRIGIPVGQPMLCQHLAVMFVSLDDHSLDLNVGRFQVLGKGCLRL